MLTMEYVCYNGENPDEIKTVEVSGASVSACREAALAKSGLNRILSAKVLDGDIEPEIASGALRRK